MKRTPHRVGLFLAAACAVALCGCQSKIAEQKDQFIQGREAVCSGRYEAAVPLLEAYLREFPTGEFASRAGLFLGKAHIALGNYSKARAAWQDTIDRFPETLEGHKCRYKLAVLALVQGHTADAQARFAAMAGAPDGPLAAEAGALAAYLKRIPAEADGS